MIKRSQTIRWRQPTNSLSVFDHFMKLDINGLSELINFIPLDIIRKA